MRSFVAMAVLLLAFTTSAQAFEPKFVNALKDSEVTAEDLVNFLDIDYSKYTAMLESDTEVLIVFRDLKRGRDVFRHKVEIEKFGEYTMRLWFRKYDDSIGKAFTPDTKNINYSLNWNQERVFSGTITNPIADIAKVYRVGYTYPYGKELDKKTPLLEFYRYEDDSDNEELIAELYIVTQRRP